jgi:hypothetical protein
MDCLDAIAPTAAEDGERVYILADFAASGRYEQDHASVQRVIADARFGLGNRAFVTGDGRK